jgi:hypothetical protein
MSRRLLLALVLLLLAIIFLSNARALYEGIFFYLPAVVTYDPRAVGPISREGRYASVYDLVRLRNVERLAYLRHRLDSPKIAVALIPIPDSPFPVVFLRCGRLSSVLYLGRGPQTRLCVRGRRDNRL